MVFDWDDFHENNHRLIRFHQLKAFRPDFRCTLFAIPALGTDEFWNSLPDWLELAVHGWEHPTPLECANWTYERMLQAIDEKPARFVDGFKAPGWQISDGCYQALLERGWWVADQTYNDHRRPNNLRVHRLGDGEHWHGHIQDVCGNGLEETWERVVGLVKSAPSFQFVSEVACVRGG